MDVGVINLFHKEEVRITKGGVMTLPNSLAEIDL